MAFALKTPEAPSSSAPTDVEKKVAGRNADIRSRGDEAVREYSSRFDDWSPESFRLSPEQIDSALSQLPQQVRDDIEYVPAPGPLLRRAAAGVDA